VSERSRVEQRDELLTALGMLIAPINELIDSLDVKRHTAPLVQGKFEAEFSRFTSKYLQPYCLSDDQVYRDAWLNSLNTLEGFTEVTAKCRNPDVPANKLRSMFNHKLTVIHKVIRTIPCDDPGIVFSSESPFQTFLRLRAVCVGTSNRLDLFDPYLIADVFHRYLPDVPAAATLTIVTSEKVMLGADTNRRDRIVAVSELLALERKANYRFLVTQQQHDRHCRADNDILHLGGSVGHASMYAPYTLSKLDSTQSNHAFLDSVIAGATEWYGPNVQTHRRV
jgi:hypothetical protein